MKTTKTISIIGTHGWEIRNNYKTVCYVANLYKAIEIAKKVDPTKDIIVKDLMEETTQKIKASQI